MLRSRVLIAVSGPLSVERSIEFMRSSTGTTGETSTFFLYSDYASTLSFHRIYFSKSISSNFLFNLESQYTGEALF
jgi:hypothetical protein